MSSDSEQELISDVDSYASVEMDIQALSHLISELYGKAEELEERLSTLHKPLEGTQIDQFGQLAFVAASPFRNATFAIKPPVLSAFSPHDRNQRHSFHQICTILRNYLISCDAVRDDGSITLNAQLQHLFGIQDTTIGYIALLGHLRNVLI
jgi:hypothetical protein